MINYSAQSFNISELAGISQKTIDEHLKLYQGYVKHVNLIHELIKAQKDIINGNEVDPSATYALKEATRRLGFEFGGMRNHEYYFRALEGGAQSLDKSLALYQKITSQFGSYENWWSNYRQMITAQRGVGWAMLGYDQQTEQLINYWVDEQHLGQLPTVQIVLALDMWEHSYCMDYAPSQKSDYIEAYFNNLNWVTVNHRFLEASQ